jgi:hypothetical protein
VTSLTVISGGQTGVDRAALDVALALGLPYGGWCPRGGWAEDLTAPPGLLARYPSLRETPLADPAQRTAWNVHDSDAVLIVADGDLAVSAGSTLARQQALAAGKPVLLVDLGRTDAAAIAAAWLQARLRDASGTLMLGIGGPRESERPGIYVRAREFLLVLLRDV